MLWFPCELATQERENKVNLWRNSSQNEPECWVISVAELLLHVPVSKFGNFEVSLCVCAALMKTCAGHKLSLAVFQRLMIHIHVLGGKGRYAQREWWCL